MTVSDWPASNSSVIAGRSRVSLVLLLLPSLVYAYFPTIQWLFSQWWGDGPFVSEARNWSHGFLVALMLGYVLWRKRGEFSGGGSAGWGVPVVALSLGLNFIGVLLAMPYLSAASLVPAALGTVGLLYGFGTLRRLLVPLLLLLLAVPFPVEEWGVSGFLARIVATASPPLAALTGAPVIRSGQFIIVGEYQYEVIGLCSGFNFVMALLALVLPLLSLRGASLKALGMALLWVPAVGMVTKVALVSTVLVLTPRLGQDAALSLYHGWLGVLFFVGGLGIALLLAGLSRQRAASSFAAKIAG
ncbi:MAG: exosortase/archaeosortase family protein [Chloroflexi bacterium]|nr:exosortase/archaeosortase family protein [Chloroflexota bacterium]